MLVAQPGTGFSLAPSSLTATYNVAVSTTLAASGRVAPYTYAVASGALPPGLTLNGTTGLISGTCTAPGSYSVTLRATDSTGSVGLFPRTFVVASDLVLTPASISSKPVSVAVSGITFAATGGVAPYTFAVVSGALPTGLSLNTSTGVLSGTPTVVGTASFTVRVTDATAATLSVPYTLQIIANLTVSPAAGALTAGVVGTAYTQTFTTTGGTAPYAYTVASGSIPAGLTLNPTTGILSGTPTTGGSHSFSIMSTDANGATKANAHTLAITTTVSLTPTTAPTGAVARAYTLTLVATGGTTPYTYAVDSGALPAGVTLNTSTGAVTGTPTTEGDYSFSLRVTAANGVTVVNSYSMTVNAQLAVTPGAGLLKRMVVGRAYTETIAASGGFPGYTYAVTSGAIPAGLSFNTGTGVISGTPTTAGAASFTISATDAQSGVVPVTYTPTITPALTLDPSTLPGGTVNTAYTQAVTGNGGTTPYSYALSAGALPDGILLDPATGSVSGTPTTAGATSFTIMVTDAQGGTATRAYTPTFAASFSITSPASMPDDTGGTTYSQTLAATGGTSPYTWSKLSGSFPPGLSLNSSTGVLSGTSTNDGTYSFVIQATDSVGATATKSYSIVITAPTITLAAPDTTGKRTVAYSSSVATSGGTAPRTYAIISGGLPDGMSLNSSTGAITGTPTNSGTFAFTVRATDTYGFTGTRSVSLAIAKTPVSTYVTVDSSPTSMSSATISWSSASIGTAHDRRFVVVGFSYLFNAAGSSLPTKVTIGGVTATRLSYATSGSAGPTVKTFAALYCALVPTGSTATIVVTLPTGAYNSTYTKAAISIFTAVDLTDATASSSDSHGGMAVLSGTVTSVNPSLIFGVSATLANAVYTADWTYLTRRSNAAVAVSGSQFIHSGANSGTITTGGGKTQGVDWTGQQISAAAWAALN